LKRKLIGDILVEQP